MALTFTWSEDANGPSVDLPLDLGSGGVGEDDPEEVLLWVRHDHVVPVTNARLYIGPYSGDDYEGVLEPQHDWEDILEGGDGSGDTIYGILQVNVDEDNDFPEASWRTVTSDYGSTLDTAILLGDIPTGDGKSIKLRFDFLDDIDSGNEVGIRQIDLRLTYTYIE